MFDVCPYPGGLPHQIEKLPNHITTLIVVGWDGAHYGFLEITVPNRYVLVKDGFLNHSSIPKWFNHVKFMLLKWGLMKVSLSQVQVSKHILTDFEQNAPTTPESVFEIIPLRTVVQRNVTECGAITAYHAWEIIDPMSKPLVVDSFRQDIIQELLSMWDEFDNVLHYRVKISKVRDPKKIVRLNVDGKPKGMMDLGHEDDNDDNDDGKTKGSYGCGL
jgi:hypothetical protein